MELSEFVNFDVCEIILFWLCYDLSGVVFFNFRSVVKKLLGIIKWIVERKGESFLVDKIVIFYGFLEFDRW